MSKWAIYENEKEDIASNKKRVAALQGMEIGKTYVVYKPTQKANNAYARAVACKRTLVGHHNGYARFLKKTKYFDSYESFTYGELLSILQKPNGAKITREGEEDE